MKMKTNIILVGLLLLVTGVELERLGKRYRDHLQHFDVYDNLGRGLARAGREVPLSSYEQEVEAQATPTDEESDVGLLEELELQVFDLPQPSEVEPAARPVGAVQGKASETVKERAIETVQGRASETVEERAIETVQGKASEKVQGGKGSIDFSSGKRVVQPDGTAKYCREKTETRDKLIKDPVLECIHKSVEKCHYTYSTMFVPTQEEVCEENFVKHCSIMYRKMAVNETFNHCYRPLVRDCSKSSDQETEEVCRDYFESSCSTKYVEKPNGKFVGDTACEKIPVRLCGDASCQMVEGPEECHDKMTASIQEVPEEHCDLTPQKTCRHKTTLVPKLQPVQECTILPKEVCNIKYENTRIEKVPFTSLWCQDEEPETEADKLSDGSETITSLQPDIPQYSTTTQITPISDGYLYPTPSNPLNPQRPQVVSPKPTSRPVISMTINIPPPPTTRPTTPPPPPTTRPTTPPPKQQVVGVRPEDLEAAVIAAIEEAVAQAVANAAALADSLESKNQLTLAVTLAVEQAVTDSLASAVNAQVASNRPQSSRNLEKIIKEAIREAVQSSVKSAVDPRMGVDETMSDAMKSDLNMMENTIEATLIQAVRKAVRQSLKVALENKVEQTSVETVLKQNSVQPQTVQKVELENNLVSKDTVQRQNSEFASSVKAAVQSAVQRAIKLAFEKRGDAERQAARIAIQQAVNQAVATSIKNTIQSSRNQMSQQQIKAAVTNAVMLTIRQALTASRLSDSNQMNDRQQDALAAALGEAVRKAIENRLKSLK